MSCGSWSPQTVDEAIDFAAGKLGYPCLKEQHRYALKSFVLGNDVFVILPTGYRKTLYLVLLPWVFDWLRQVSNASIVLCVYMRARLRG